MSIRVPSLTIYDHFLLTTVGTDYNAVTQTLVFNADTSRICFDTSTVPDDLLEDDEVYRLTLTSDEPGLTLNPSEATVTIEDDDREFSTPYIAWLKFDNIILLCSGYYWFD